MIFSRFRPGFQGTTIITSPILTGFKIVVIILLFKPDIILTRIKFNCVQMGKATVCNGPTHHNRGAILRVHGSWNLYGFLYSCSLSLGPHCRLSDSLAHLVYYGLVSTAFSSGKKTNKNY